MSSPNSFGQLFKITTFGESHGPAMGVVVEGCPAGVRWKEEYFTDFISRRRPGSSVLVSARDESDTPEVLSGVFEGVTLGTPIALLVKNKDQRSSDYEQVKMTPRSGHADDMWKGKFLHSDHRGGGRSSGRETLCRVMAGALAKNFVKQVHPELEVVSKALQIGPLKSSESDFDAQIEKLLVQAKESGQSYGGLAQLRICAAPQFLGEPVFKKLKSEFAAAFMSVGAVVGVELGDGFSVAGREGVEFHTHSKGYGGIRGGMSTGEDIIFQIAMKPTSSVMDVAKQGRHDPCILLRALVVFEAMAWLVLADQILHRRLNTL